MDEATYELAELIAEFIGIAFADEARDRLVAEAIELGTTYEQFLAMSLTQLITNRFQLTTLADPEQREGDEDE